MCPPDARVNRRATSRVAHREDGDGWTRVPARHAYFHPPKLATGNNRDGPPTSRPGLRGRESAEREGSCQRSTWIASSDEIFRNAEWQTGTLDIRQQARRHVDVIERR